MASMLNRMSLKQKLILFAAIPTVVVLIFGTLRMLTLFERFHVAHTNSTAITITQQIESLIFEVQKERGLSAGYLSSQDNQYQRKLISQREMTDSHIAALLDNANLTSLLQWFDNADHNKSLAVKIQRIMLLTQQLTTVRQQVDSKQGNQSFDYYSELNLNLLRFIDQLQIRSNSIAQSQAYNDLLHVLHIQELAGKQRGLVNRLLSSKQLESETFLAINHVESELQEQTVEALSTMRPQHRQVLDQILNSNSNSTLLSMRDNIAVQMRIVDQAHEINKLMGYGGLIHAFKNYLLRGEDHYYQLFHTHLETLQQYLNQLSNTPGLTEAQQAAVAAIKSTVSLYKHNLDELSVLKQTGSDISAQDKHVRINDQPMLKALEVLQAQQPLVSNVQWWNTASHRIEALYQLSTSITQELATLSATERQQAVSYLIIGFSIAILNLVLLLFFGRNLIRSLVGSITQIVNAMGKMAKDPQLEHRFTVRGNDEIAQLSQSLNTMLDERKKSHSQLELAAAVFEYSAEGIVVTNKDNLIELINPAFTQITGYSLDEVKGRSPAILNSNQQPRHFYDSMWQSLQEKDRWEGEIWNRRKDGQIYPEYLAITVVRDDDGNIVHHIGLFLDISKRKKYEHDIWYKTNFDALTNLPNRHLYNTRFQEALDAATQDRQPIAILFIDLDRFKYTNDIYGHNTGNELLKLVAARLETLLGKEDFLARLSGDEFVIIMQKIANPQAIQRMADQIVQHLSSPFGVLNNEVMISASVGISQFPDNGDDIETLTRNAETAMYQAKGEGRNTYRYFSSTMNQQMIARIELEQHLRHAVIHHHFCLHYQPIIDMHSGDIVAVEALIRWNDPKQGLISPDAFIPIAEETGLIEPIGEWVVQQALTDLRQWHDQGHMINMAINVSGRQLINAQQKSFHCLLQGWLQKLDIEPSYVHVEITESMLMADKELSLQALASIRALGIDIYIDDFGTGFSSLSYLTRFPISVIKIDKSFIDNMIEKNSDANLIKAIIQMGKSLELNLVAEGIETLEQHAYLQQLGCDYGQGYYISKPLPAVQLLNLLKTKTDDKHRFEGQSFNI
ncbi:EAL domain-containing protein [Shewanella waksmanii]|uniref:EAL domain-containing protein n=1 Tax=Shewanella waksmanii TaxID=213783 RepID=UPI0004ACFC1B|nr:EAL domain-containing protein [Shewanella waksmanii]